MNKKNSSTTEKTELKKQKYLVDSWLSNLVFKDWILKNRENTRAKSTICHNVIELSSGGCSALSVHGNGRKPKESVEKKMNFFKPKKQSVSEVTAVNKNCPAQESKQQTIDNSFGDSQSVKAENIWTLKTVMSRYSIRSNDDLTKTLSVMFPEFESFRNFDLARTKSMHAFNRGLAPFFKSFLYENLTRSVLYVYCFDESLNEVTQACEMDMYIRYSVCFFKLNELKNKMLL